ncbi:MAG: bifunctional UDP-sugar hydrolase/5'-nucleotidase [Pseudomonadota bacterium]
MNPRQHLVLVFLAAAGCAHPAVPPQAPAHGHLVLLHTNDTHSHYGPTPAPWIEGKPAIGGFEALSSYLETQRALTPAADLLVLDAGDVLSGTPLSELEADGIRGGEVLGFMAELGYDAQALGNHEFDQGFEGVSAFVGASEVPILCANLAAPDGTPDLPGLQPSLVFTRGGVKIGLIGVVTDELQRLVSAETWSHLHFQGPVEAVTAEARRLDPETDLLIVLSHAGLETDRVLAERVPFIDLIVGAHSHDAILTPELVHGVYIVQAGSYTRSVGRLEIHVADDAIAELQGGLVDLVPLRDWKPATEAVQARLARVSADVDARFGQVIGHLTAPMERDSYRQGSLGVFVAGALLRQSGADLAFYNPGGLRADLPAGDITHADLYQVLPFGNEAVTFQMSGEEIRRLAERAAFAEATRKTSAPQCAGLAWTWRPGQGGQELLDVTVGGAPLDPAKTYTVASNAYVGEHLDESYSVPERPLQSVGGTVLDLVERGLGEEPITPPPTRSMKVE